GPSIQPGSADVVHEVIRSDGWCVRCELCLHLGKLCSSSISRRGHALRHTSRQENCGSDEWGNRAKTTARHHRGPPPGTTGGRPHAHLRMLRRSSHTRTVPKAERYWNSIQG